MMQGWKTWAAAILSIAYGVGGYLLTIHDADTAAGFVTAGLALVGVGHKLDKLKGA